MCISPKNSIYFKNKFEKSHVFPELKKANGNRRNTSKESKLNLSNLHFQNHDIQRNTPVISESKIKPLFKKIHSRPKSDLKFIKMDNKIQKSPENFHQMTLFNNQKSFGNPKIMDKVGKYSQNLET